MTFDDARTLSLILHYVVILGAAALFVLRKPTIVRIFLRTYIALFVWIGLTLVCNGCPLTHLENWLSYKIYQKEFYPAYSFMDSDASQFLGHSDLLLPLVLIFFIWVLFPGGFKTAR